MTTGVHVTEISLSRKALLSLAVLLPSLSTSCLTQTASAQPATKADLVLINGTILTVDPQDSIAEALAIQAGKIIAVGSKQQILALTDAHTQILDLHGRTATPGLIDTHGHYQDAGVDQLYNIDLSDAKSIAEIVRRVEAKVATTKPGEWVRGAGWDEGKLAENRYVYASDLDKVSPNNPVWLRNTTGHYATVNSYALRLAHINNESKDPPAGTIDRDKSGAITGVLKEQASLVVLRDHSSAFPGTAQAGHTQEHQRPPRRGHDLHQGHRQPVHMDRLPATPCRRKTGRARLHAVARRRHARNGKEDPRGDPEKSPSAAISRRRQTGRLRSKNLHGRQYRRAHRMGQPAMAQEFHRDRRRQLRLSQHRP